MSKILDIAQEMAHDLFKAGAMDEIKAVPNTETRAADEKTPEGAEGEPYADCFARACRHLVNKRCNLYTTGRPPIIVVDGRCMGYET